MIGETNKQFQEEVETRLNQYLAGQPKITRQSVATKRGQIVEDVAYEFLAKSKHVVSIERQVFIPEVDEFSNIDLVIKLSNDKTVYLPCARDLWLGTSQQDRLQLIYYKQKLWETKPTQFPANSFFCYLCFDNYQDFLADVLTKRARRKAKLQEVVKLLANDGIIHNMETLLDFINKVATE